MVQCFSPKQTTKVMCNERKSGNTEIPTTKAIFPSQTNQNCDHTEITCTKACSEYGINSENENENKIQKLSKHIIWHQ